MKRLASLILLFATLTLHAIPEPEIGAALWHEGAHEISVIYSEPVDPSTITNPDNYTLSQGSLSTIRLAATNQGAILRVTGLATGASVSVSIANVTDPAGNNVPPASLEFTVTPRLWAEIGANELGFRSEAYGLPTNGFDVFSGGVQQRNEYDDATFVGDPVSGDFDVKVRVDYVEPAGAGAKAGIMVREQLDEARQRPTDPDDPAQAFSRYVELSVSAPVAATGEAAGTHQIWQRLVSPGFETISLTVTNDAPPAFTNAWLRVERIGQEFKMYRGADGVNWTQIGGATFNTAFSTNAFVGVAFSPQNDDISPDTGLRKSFVAKFRDYNLITTTNDSTRIRIEMKGTHAEVSWDAGWTLQSAPTVLGPWGDHATATSPFRVDFTEPRRFFRVRK